MAVDREDRTRALVLYRWRVHGALYKGNRLQPDAAKPYPRVNRQIRDYAAACREVITIEQRHAAVEMVIQLPTSSRIRARAFNVESRDCSIIENFPTTLFES